MKSFDKELKQFTIDGTFDNNLDDVGNINLSIDPIDVNQRYIEFQFRNYIYKNDQISELYDVEIKEFSIPTTEILNSNTDSNLDQLVRENEDLRTQLNTVIASENERSANAVVDASKDVIVKLRIQLNEGTVPDDFSDAFPYLKK